MVPSTHFAGESALKVKIRVYNVTGEVTKLRATVPRGTRFLFTCDVAGLPEGHVAINYKWYHSSGAGRSEVQEDDPYYTAMNDTLLVDTISWGGMRRWHICEVEDANDFFTLTLTGWCTVQMCWLRNIHHIPLLLAIQIALLPSCSPQHPSFPSMPFSLMYNR